MDMNHPARKPSGFSAVELMVVLVVMGILVAIGFPTMSGFIRSARITGAQQTLSGDIHDASALATAQRRTYRILLTSSSYKIQKVSPLTTIQTRQMPPGVTAAATDTPTFFAWGLAKPVTLTLTDSHGTTTLRLLANGRLANN